MPPSANALKRYRKEGIVAYAPNPSGPNALRDNATVASARKPPNTLPAVPQRAFAAIKRARDRPERESRVMGSRRRTHDNVPCWAFPDGFGNDIGARRKLK